MSRNSMTRSLAIVLVAFGIRAECSRADFIPIPAPNASYLASTTRINITPPDFTPLTSLSDNLLTVSFSSPLEVRTVPTTWASWASPPASESATPRVLYTGNPFPSTGIDLTFSRSISPFVVEMEPNNSSTLFTLTATFFSGATLVGSISLPTSGTAGSRLFAGATSNQAFTRVNLSAPPESGGLAIAQVRYAIPEPSGLTLLGLGSVGLIAWRAWERRCGKRGGLLRAQPDPRGRDFQ
jgi:hypothetical protein